MTPAVYLKREERIVALAMVMCLCLLVYMIAQHYLRQSLARAKAAVPNQLGKATQTPTMRWIFQLFEGVHLLIRTTSNKIEEIILNITPVRAHVLAILGPQFEKMYANGEECAECGFSRSQSEIYRNRLFKHRELSLTQVQWRPDPGKSLN